MYRGALALLLGGLGVSLATGPGLAQEQDPPAAGTGRILTSTLAGTITPVMADHLDEGVERAAAEGFEAYLIELDTPGGLDRSMRDIIQTVLGSDVPVVVYVAPQGARAASAGSMITLASHVAAMAPGTTIGAATPVSIQGEEVEDKVINDAAAYAEALAELRGRDVEFAVATVREGRSVVAERALEIGAIDLVVPNRAELLEALDGRTVQLRDGVEVTLATRGAELVPHELSWLRRVLQWLADPNVAFLFLSLGTLAILYEIANPGVGFGAIAGVILLVLAFFSLAVLPVTATGILLLVLAAGLFVAELFVPGIGVFAGGGAVSLALAGLFLFRGPIGVDLAVLLPTVAVVGGGAIVVGRLVWRTRSLHGTTGVSGLVDARGTVRVAEGSRGQAFVNGALWNVRADAPLAEGQEVRVVGVEGLDLVVEREEENA